MCEQVEVPVPTSYVNLSIAASWYPPQALLSQEVPTAFMLIAELAMYSYILVFPIVSAVCRLPSKTAAFGSE